MGTSGNSSSSGFLNDQLSKKTSILGLRLWVLIGIGVGVFIVLILLCLSIWLTSRKKSKRLPEKLPSALIPMISKEIQEVRIDPLGGAQFAREDSSDRDMEKSVLQIGYGHLSKPSSDTERASSEADSGINVKPIERQSLLRPHSQKPQKKVEEGRHEIGVVVERDRVNAGDRHGFVSSDKGSTASGETPRSTESPSTSVPEVSHLGWGHWYILRDLEIATNGFSDDNVIGEGGYGIVYRGLLPNGTL